MPISKPPDQHYFDGISIASNAVGMLAAPTIDQYNRFWNDPVGEAAELNKQARNAKTNAASTFQNHGLILNFLALVRPEELAKLRPSSPPIPMDFFDENGDIDIPALTTAWETHLATLPTPES